MPPGNLASWHTDPYELTAVGSGGLAGLGVADMKSGVAAALLAAGAWRPIPAGRAASTCCSSRTRRTARTTG